MKKTLLTLLCATSMLSGIAVVQAKDKADMLPPPPPQDEMNLTYEGKAPEHKKFDKSIPVQSPIIPQKIIIRINAPLLISIPFLFFFFILPPIILLGYH